MKFDVWKGIMSQSSHIKFQPYPVKGVLGGGAKPKLLGKCLEWRDRDETWWEK